MLTNPSPDEPRYPHVPEAKSLDDTAQDAAASAAVNNQALKKLCLDAIKHRPGAMYEIAARLNRSTYSVAPVLSQLRKLGLIEDSKKRYVNPSGKKGIVWQVTSSSVQ